MAANATVLEIRAVVSKQAVNVSESELRSVENSILLAGKKLAAEKNISGLEVLMKEVEPLYNVIGRARAAKLLKELIEYCLIVDLGKEEKVSLVKKSIQWAEDNKRVFLRRNLEARLVRLHNDNGNYPEALVVAAPLNRELKKLEDRELLMDVALEESRAAFALKNLAKAKASLVLAKTNSNGAYVSQSMQASIDMQSGILYSADEKDYKTAYSYFYEAAEGYVAAQETHSAAKAVKYMCLCKIMSNEADQVPILLATKAMSSLKGRDVEAMVLMANAFATRSLSKFQQVFDKYEKEVIGDPVVSAHSQELHKHMLEKEITRVIEPYSEIEFSQIVKKVGLPQERIEKAIATMLLDKKIYGCIDQHNGTVRIFPFIPADKAYLKGVELIRALSKAVDAIYNRAASKIK